jgi:hypothetical protein
MGAAAPGRRLPAVIEQGPDINLIVIVEVAFGKSIHIDTCHIIPSGATFRG